MDKSPRIIDPFKVRVLFVKDDHNLNNGSTEDEIRNSRAQEIRSFWEQASQFCSDHDQYKTDQPCQDCPFDLVFCAWFPEALFRLLKGERYDTYIIDLVLTAHNLNTWGHPKYAKDAEQLAGQIADQNGRQIPSHAHIGGEVVLRYIRPAPYYRSPLVAIESSLSRPSDRPHLAGYCTHDYGDSADDLYRILMLSLSRTRDFVAEGLSNKPPLSLLPAAQRPPVQIIFCGCDDRGNRSLHLHISGSTHVYAATNLVLKTYRTDESFTYSGTRPRVKIVRRCIRMGPHGIIKPVDATHFGVTHAFNIILRDCNAETREILEWVNGRIQEEASGRGCARKVWRSHPEIETSVESAWQHLYFGVVLVTVASMNWRKKSSTIDKFLKQIEGQRLYNDACLLRPTVHTIETAKFCFEQAQKLGCDIISDDDEFQDIEMLLVPEIGRLCCVLLGNLGHATLSESARQQLKSITDQIFNFFKPPPSRNKVSWFFVMKYWLNTLHSLGEKRIEPDHLVAQLIKQYSMGISMYWDAYKYYETIC